MRLPNFEYGSYNAARSRNRRYVYRFIFDPADNSKDLYISSHRDVVLTPGTLGPNGLTVQGTHISSRISKSPFVTQTLQMQRGSSSVGNFSFEIADSGRELETFLQDRLQNDSLGLRGKTMNFYSGFKETVFQNFELEGTQVFTGHQPKGLSHTFTTEDKTRLLQTDIAEPVELRLAAPLLKGDTTIQVHGLTTALRPHEHGTSYTDGSIAGQEYSYLRIDRKEVVRVLASDIQASQLVNVDRGQLGTRPVEHVVDENTSDARGKKIEEVYVFEMPFAKLAYALLTGVLINQTGTLPEGLHGGADPQDDVELASFLAHFNPADDTEGLIDQHIFYKRKSLKRFLEQRVLAKYNFALVVDSAGRINLKKIPGTISGASPTGMITDRELIPGTIVVTNNFKDIRNRLRINWNEINGETTRTLPVLDDESIIRHGPTEWEDVEALGWVGQRNTEDQIIKLIEARFDVKAGPANELTVRCQSSVNNYEVGDILRLKTTHAVDPNGESLGLYDRSHLVINVRKDLDKGRVSYKLYGSTHKSTPQRPPTSGSVIPDAEYIRGTDIATMPGVIDTGSELVLPDGLFFAGGASWRDPIASYYALKDVNLPVGNIVRGDNNVALWIRGNFTHGGDLGDGTTFGIPGVADTFDVSTIPLFPAGGETPLDYQLQPGVPSFIGTTQAGGGLIEILRGRSDSGSRYRGSFQSVPGPVVTGAFDSVPSLDPIWDGSEIVGVPDDLRGSSGGPGGLRHFSDTEGSDTIETNRGGTGGAGGMSWIIIARGYTRTLTGRVNVSGQDGALGEYNGANVLPAHAGAGAGGAHGALIYIADGDTVNTPVFTNGSVIAGVGESPLPTEGTFNIVDDAWRTITDDRIEPIDRISYYAVSAASGREAGLAAYRTFFVRDPTAAVEDQTDEELAGTQVISFASVNTFYDGELDPTNTSYQVTISQDSVTAAYAHANIFTRVLGTELWIEQGPTLNNVANFKLPANGDTYEIQARPVLINGQPAADGVIQQTLAIDRQVPPPQISSVQPFNLVEGVKLVIMVPDTAGVPRRVEIYRGTNSTGPFTAVGEQGGRFNTSTNEWCFEFLDPDVTGGTDYWYKFRVYNEYTVGVPAFFPTAAAGVAAAPIAVGSGGPGTPGEAAWNIQGQRAVSNSLQVGGAWPAIADNIISVVEGTALRGTVTIQAAIDQATGFITLSDTNPTGSAAAELTIAYDDNGTSRNPVARFMWSNGTLGSVTYYAVRDGAPALISYMPTAVGGGNYGDMTGLSSTDMNGSSGVAVIDSDDAFIGAQSLKVTQSTGLNPGAYFNPTPLATPNIVLPPNRRWLVTAYLFSDDQINLAARFGLVSIGGSFTWSSTVPNVAGLGVWTLQGFVIDMTAQADTELSLIVQATSVVMDSGGNSYRVDGVSLYDVTDLAQYDENNLPPAIYVPPAKGSDGTQGIPGDPGASGTTTYTWIAYADDITGSTNFTTGNPGTRQYIGISSNQTTPTESTDRLDYSWAKFVGDNGDQGIPGDPGINGVTTYTWIAYANSADGTTDFTTGAPGSRTYIGISPNQTTATEGTNPASYQWSLIKGDKGDQGIQGIPGDPGINGTTTYTWIAYADDITGSTNFTTGNPGTREYIGIASNRTTATEGTNPASYVWSKFVGDQGDQGDQGFQGIPGDPGVNGVTTYTWIAYANSADGTTDFTTGAPGSRTYIGISPNQTTATEGTNPASYQWSLIKGDKGDKGDTGDPGAPGGDGTLLFGSASSSSFTPTVSVAYAAVVDGAPGQIAGNVLMVGSGVPASPPPATTDILIKRAGVTIKTITVQVPYTILSIINPNDSIVWSYSVPIVFPTTFSGSATYSIEAGYQTGVSVSELEIQITQQGVA